MKSCYMISEMNFSKFYVVAYCLLADLHPAQEFFTYMEASLLPVKACKIYAYARRSGPLSREGSILCHSCCNMGPQFFLSHLKNHPIQWPLMTCKEILRTYSNQDP
jgi:hypothetical protein